MRLIVNNRLRVKPKVANASPDSEAEFVPSRDKSSPQQHVTASQPLQTPPGAFDKVEIERLCKNYDAVLLYGDCARGDAKPDSDVDILVLSETKAQELRVPNHFINGTY